ncbi:MAG TPA: hypothetical protein DCP69_00705 [Candidatus Omnitrophica bacterium]|nr:hypothetical protein [Candidatus Omnitrophota bacterium]
MATGNVDIVVKLVDKASRGLSAIGQKASGLAKTLGGALRAGALAGGVALVGLVGIGIKLIKAAAQEEAGIKRLAAAVNASGGSWAKSGKAIEAVIKQRQRLAFSDDDLRSSMALLTAITGDVDEALRRQAIAMDFARGANIDLNTASKLLGKVTDENVNVLGRYGIRIEKGASSMELLRLVQQKFSGQSAAFADSTAGKWQNFNIALDDVKETIGAALLPLASQLADKLATFLRDHEEQIGLTVRRWTEWGQNTAFPAILNFLRDARPIAQKWFDTFKVGLMDVKAVFLYVFGNKAALIAALLAIGAAVYISFGPVGLAAAAMVSFILLLGVIHKNLDAIKTTSQKLGPVFTALSAPLWLMASPLLLVGLAVGVVATNFERLRRAILNLPKLPGWLGGLAGGVWSVLGQGLIRAHQFGGITSTPFQVVGERGPELAALPMGSRVFPAGQTRQMLGGGGVTIINNISGTWDLSNPNHIEQLTSALTGQIRRNLAMGA